MWTSICSRRLSLLSVSAGSCLRSVGQRQNKWLLLQAKNRFSHLALVPAVTWSPGTGNSLVFITLQPSTLSVLGLLQVTFCLTPLLRLLASHSSGSVLVFSKSRFTVFFDEASIHLEMELSESHDQGSLLFTDLVYKLRPG